MNPVRESLPYDGLTLQLYKFVHPRHDRLLIISHGLGENGLRFTHVAEYFYGAGYDVVAFDHQGHGRSTGARGTIVSAASLVAETAAVLAAVNQPRYVHRVLFGHSMGGLLGLAALREPSFAMQLSAAIISAPALALGFEPPKLLVALAGVAARVAPNLTKSNDLDLTALSRDPTVAERYSADPINHDRLSMRLAHLFLELPKRLLAEPHDIEIPLLLTHGDADRICAVSGSRAYAELHVGGEVTLKEWPGGYHEMHHEPEQSEVLAYYKTFLDEHLN